jgi:hypothetical protein
LSPNTLNTRLNGLQNRSESFGEEENVLPPPEIKVLFLGCPPCSLSHYIDYDILDLQVNWERIVKLERKKE